ncbi:MAG TPA: hypothetical protein VLS49_07075 [Usitatibacter sp.]|nr:hypothetical protein [Usitatibacter sp.]
MDDDERDLDAATLADEQLEADAEEAALDGGTDLWPASVEARRDGPQLRLW